MADIDFTSKETQAMIQLLQEISGKASLVKELCNQACGRGGDADLDAAAAELAAVIGLVADDASLMLGGHTMVGGAQEWLLSPVLQELLGSNKAEAH